MTTTTQNATHRVFDALQGLYPVTFANVREADPEGLLDIFEGADNTRDRYFEKVIDWKDWLNLQQSTDRGVAGRLWATYLSGFDTDHTMECDQGPGCCKSSEWCSCKKGQFLANEQWGEELMEAIKQRIEELNG